MRALRASSVMRVISDRYHPAMAAHRLGADVQIIDTERYGWHKMGAKRYGWLGEKDGWRTPPGGKVCAPYGETYTKLRGACQMISKYDANATSHLNRVAWEELRRAIMIRAPPSTGGVRKVGAATGGHGAAGKGLREWGI